MVKTVSAPSKSVASNVVFGLVMALPFGFVFASIYATFHDGFSQYKIENLDPLAFWYQTPFVPGYSTDVWHTGLMIIGATAVAALFLIVGASMRSPSAHNGTAQWGDPAHMATLGYLKAYKTITGPIFGKVGNPRSHGKFLTNAEQPHSLVVAPTRAGKGVGIVVPTLLTFDGSIVALDVKGELFELTSRARLKRGDRVYKFSPLDRNGRTHCYNPVLDIVAAPPGRRFLEARRLATNLIVAKGKGSEGFIDGARDLFVAGILACIERGTPTIGAVYDLFALPGEKYKLFAQLAEESKTPEAQRIFDNMASNDTKIITSYTSVLGDGGLNLWADGLIKQATSRSDFSIYNLRRDPATIYIVVSPNDLEVVAPLIRLFFQQIVSIMQREIPGKDETFEVLFLLDEFKHLGRLEAIETAITTIAGYKGRFMFIIQSLAALTGNYEQSGKENFLGNTGIQVFMATADDETPQYISKAIGDYTYESKSKSWSMRERFNTNTQVSMQGAPLIRPEQVRLLDDDMQIVLIKGQSPMKMHKIKYYADRNLKRIFESQKGALPEPEPLGDYQNIVVPAQQAAAPELELDEEASAVIDIEPSEQREYSSDDFEVRPSLPVDLMLDQFLSESPVLEEFDEPAPPAKHHAATKGASKAKAGKAKPKAQPANPQQALLEKIIALQTKAKGMDHGSNRKGEGA